MIKPYSLKEGDTIGIISPASPITENHMEKFQNGIAILRNLGYNIILGKHVYDSTGYLAGKDKDRAYDINKMFSNENVKAIFCSRGGYGCERLIDYIDLNNIQNNPKIFVGYSNISFLLNKFAQSCGLITFHGPMVINLGINDFNVDNLFSLLSFPKDRFTINKNPCKGIYKSNYKASGILLGGNLSTIVGTLGTRYEISTENCILFIEEVNEPSYSIDRMITHLLNYGKLNLCKGFIIGDFTDCNSSKEVECINVIKERLFKLGKPIVYFLKAGHGDIKTTLPIGSQVEINARSGFVEALENIII